MATAFFSSACLGFTNFMNLMETGLGSCRLPGLRSTTSTLSQTYSQRQVQPGRTPRARCWGNRGMQRHPHGAWEHPMLGAERRAGAAR